MTTIEIPELCVVALVGASGSGKSTFAASHFLPTEVLSSDTFRGLVADDQQDHSASADAFDALYHVARTRLRRGRLTVVDATNVQRADRARVVQLAKDADCHAVAVVLDVDVDTCLQHNSGRQDRRVPRHAVARHVAQLRRSRRHLRREGFRYVFTLDGPEEIDAARVERTRLWVDRSDLTGPFDIIGDVHGCREELVALLARLGYRVDPDTLAVDPPAGRMAIFLGDLVDRGPDTPGVVRLVRGMVQAGTALCVAGNHENKLVRSLSGRTVQLTHGLPETLAQLSREPAGFADEVREFLDGLLSHYVLDGGNLVVAHAGLPEAYHGRASGRVRSFALYGETTGETDEFGLPVRYDWAAQYRGDATVVYGHTPVPTAEWVNRTICIDTGCVFGGALTALRYPERELVSVPAVEVHYEPVRPLAVARPSDPGVLDLDDVAGRRAIETALAGRVTVSEEHAAAALEVMARFAADPRWLIYLPPTMSPSETSTVEGLLEHPAEAFAHYASHGVERVVCEAKHMGSRVVVVVAHDAAAAQRRFGVGEGDGGAVLTRTGRPCLDPDITAEVVDRVRGGLTRAGLWDELETDWVCLDAELLPWNARGDALVRRQFASVGAAARASLDATRTVLEATGDRVDVTDLRATVARRVAAADRFTEVYRSYCWPVAGVADLRLAPFQVLAAEGQVLIGRGHDWHMAVAARVAEVSQLCVATPHVTVDLADPDARARAVTWWEHLTAAGGEGMVVKPLRPISRDSRGRVLQPGIKCRGRDYLRIIYGPDYDARPTLEALRSRTLRHKRAMALREFALGVEALTRFVDREPLHRVHEAVFGVLAIESEPVDPRL